MKGVSMAPKSTQEATPNTDGDWFGDEGGVDETGKFSPVKVDQALDVEGMSFDDLMKALGEDVASITELDPRERIEDKDELINIPFVITNVAGHLNGEFGNPWVVVTAKTATNRLVWFTDGSTGICQQIIAMAERNPGAKAVLVPKGLVKSTYKTKDAEGKDIQGTTYYLSTAK